MARPSHALAESVRAWTGNHAGISELAESDLAELRRTPPPVLEDVRADGIDLAGVPCVPLKGPREPAPRLAHPGLHRSQARRRLADARAQLDLAELEPRRAARRREGRGVVRVLAGIAAADAACCKSLGRRSRSQDHRDAVALVRQVEPGGADAAKQLERLLGLKDQAQYGLEDVGGQRLNAPTPGASARGLRRERALADRRPLP